MDNMDNTGTSENLTCKWWGDINGPESQVLTYNVKLVEESGYNRGSHLSDPMGYCLGI